MSSKTLKASSLQKTLIVIVLVAISISAVGFYYIQNTLKETAISVGKSITASAASGNTNTDTAKSLQLKIKAVELAIAKADALYNTESTYQNQMTTDITAYALNANIKISGYTFGTKSVATTTPNSEKSLSDNGTSSMTLSLENPVQFASLMRFLQSIETNIPKMQITNLKITKGANSGFVTVDPIIIEAYIK